MLGQMLGFVAMLSGPERRFDRLDDAYRELNGRDDLVGLTVAKALPYLARDALVTVDPSLDPREADFLYSRIRDDAGEITGGHSSAAEISPSASGPTWSLALPRRAFARSRRRRLTAS